MNFQYTDEQREFQRSFRRFCEKEIAPRAMRADEAAEFQRENWRKLADFGFFSLFFAEDVGGVNADAITRVIAGEELSRVCASTALSAAASTGLTGGPIDRFGTKAQRQKYLPKMIKGELIGCFGLTEPGCGSDVQGIRTRVEKRNGDYVLSGSKMFITNGNISDVALIVAKGDESAGHRGFSAFLVETDTPGFSAGQPLNKMGLRGSPTTALHLESVTVPRDALLGEEGQGFYIAMQTLEAGRVGMAAWCLGLAQACLDEAIKYVKQREAFGRPIAHFQGVSFKIADMKLQVETARLLIHSAAWKKATVGEARVEASIAKLYASEICMKAAHMATQIHGGYGYIKEFPVERFFRDARLAEIGEGTSEIQRLVIAREVLKSYGG